MEALVWLVIAALTVIPLLKILPHFGINRYWALICVVPIGTIAMLWYMAIKLNELEKR